MKKAIMAGALAVTFFGGVAFAGGTPSTQKDLTQNQTETQWDANTGMDDTTTESGVYGGSGTEGQNVSPAPVREQPVYVAPVVVEDNRNREADDDMRGLTVLLGGGVEGYSGTLAPQVRPGFGWGVSAAIKPTKVLGLEFGYSGAVNELRGDAGTTGADVTRQGGQIAATLGLSAAPMQPYILGGVGIHHYNVRAASDSLRSDTNGAIPLGAGLRTHIGNFTADLRGTYNVMFNQDFSPEAREVNVLGLDATRGGRYQGLLQIGTTF